MNPEPTALQNHTESLQGFPNASEHSQEKIRPPLWLLLVYSYLILLTGSVIYGIATYTDPWQGLFAGIFDAIFPYGFLWAFFCLPWVLLSAWVYHHNHWQRLRRTIVLLPSLAFLCLQMTAAVNDYPTPTKRFRDLTKIDFPETAQNIQTYFYGGGLADYGDFYYFETSATETQRLIRQLKLSSPGRQGQDDLKFAIRTEPLKNLFPKAPSLSPPSAWTVHSGADEEANRHYTLITDVSQTKVFLSVSSI
ncbi:hypothetical protein [Roseibacillus ishigakijimensis]|uniref:Uncharacterized protein n=1 Tax=Roseibacillus ishigakijimensis TaxID=454146 RepID=A0A934RSW5_9BACT|nr:hypothetical protein [Roseibacillus ishigakijimensis]MBK1833610.1 hypothetical protein [Roseibacillus ishigakijimensis]